MFQGAWDLCETWFQQWLLPHWMRQRWDEFDSFREGVNAAFKHWFIWIGIHPALQSTEPLVALVFPVTFLRQQATGQRNPRHPFALLVAQLDRRSQP